MSKILWVEDFGGTGSDSDKLPLITQLLGTDIEYSEKFLDDRITKTFLGRHGVLLASTLDEGLTQIDKIDAFDFVVLDVDLPISSSGTLVNKGAIDRLKEREKLYLEVMDSSDELEDSLKRRAGFHLAMYLMLDKGFPHNHIVFFSAHADWYYELKDDHRSLQRSFIEAGMGRNPFQFFEKFPATTDGPPKIEESSHKLNESIADWVRKRRQAGNGFDYFILRRGLLDGCKEAKDTSFIPIKYQKDADGEYPKVPEDIIKGELQYFTKHFPIRTPDMPMDEVTKWKHKKYLSFLNMLLLRWQSYNTRDNSLPSLTEDLGDILVRIRNMLQHSKSVENKDILADIDESFVAFCFTMHIHALFGSAANDHKSLLAFFKKAGGGSEPEASTYMEKINSSFDEIIEKGIDWKNSKINKLNLQRQCGRITYVTTTRIMGDQKISYGLPICYRMFLHQFFPGSKKQRLYISFNEDRNPAIENKLSPPLSSKSDRWEVQYCDVIFDKAFPVNDK